MMIFGWYGTSRPSDAIFKSIYGNGPIYGGEFRFRAVGNLYFSIDVGYFSKSGRLTLTQELTKMTIIPIEGMFIFHIANWLVSPYIGAGGTAYAYEEKNVIGTVSEFGYGYIICAGATARLRFVGVDARVKYSSVRVNSADVKAELGGITLSLGAGFVF